MRAKLQKPDRLKPEKSQVRSRQRGFSLIELIVVSAILITVFSALFGFIGGTLRRLGEVTTLVKQGREGPAIINLIESDLSNAYIDTRMKDLFEAEKDEGTELRFVTSRNSIRFLNGAQADLTEVGYALKGNDLPGSVPLYTLYRREDYLLDEEPLEGGEWIPVADNVVEFQCYFYALPEEEERGRDFEFSELTLGSSEIEELDSWDKEDYYLPFAVKITLRLDIREEDQRLREDTEEEGIQAYTSFIRLPPFPHTLEHEEEERSLLQLNTGDSGPQKPEEENPNPEENQDPDPEESS